jgi:hypothetical protein
MTDDAMTARERAAEQTEIRRRLLENGYVPLANRDKMCVLPGWPGIAVDAGVIDGWADQLRYVATGVRVEGPLVVLDFDIDDVAMLDEVWARLPVRIRRLLDRAPMRFGGGDKFALFMRRAEGESVGYMISQGYAPPGSDRLMRVEVFGSGAVRQVGVYGAHSHAPDGSVARAYSWADGRGLVEVGLDDLPEISVADVTVVLDAASTAMRDGGWTYEVVTRVGEVDGRPRFDIVEDAVFETKDHGEVVGIEALEALCDVGGPGVRLSCSWLEGSSAKNLSRCIARLNVGDGRLQIWESAGCVLHRPEGLDVRSKVEELGARLRGVQCYSVTSDGDAGDAGAADAAGDAGAVAGLSVLDRLLAAVPVENRLFSSAADEGGGGPSTEERAEAEADEDALKAQLMDELVARYAYWSDGRGYVVDVGAGPEAAMSMSSFGVKLLPLSWVERGPRGGKTEVNPADLWAKDTRRMDVGGYRFLPWSRERLVEVGGQMFINTWEPPSHWGVAGADETGGGAGGEAVAALRALLAHLIPDDRERAWFTGWLAAKVQKPWVPNCGVIMVAEPQGTGRGTLFDILRAVFGRRHVRNVGSGQLLGVGSQAQYNDWLAESLLVTCDEVLTGDDSGGAMAWKRREAYERLKGLVDPRARDVMIVRKGLPNYQGEVFASFLLATNNVNALPLAADDRRIAVVTNTNRKLVDAPDVMAALEPWRTDVGFSDVLGAEVYGWLSNVAVDWMDVREAPTWMSGRARMLAANEGDMEAVLDSVLRGLAGDYVLGHELRERLGRAMAAHGLEGEVKHWWTRASDLLGRINSFGWRRRDGRCRYQSKKAGDQVAIVFYRDVPGALERWENTALDEREALWRPSGETAAKVSALKKQLRVVE